MNARRAAVSSRVAWGTAGGLAAILFVCVTWATHNVTKAQADVQNLTGQVKQLSSTTDLQAKEADRLRLNVEIARVASARAEGELVAAKTQVDQLSHEVETVKAEAVKLQAVAAKASDVVRPATQPAAATQPSASR
jgi:chromosome segregation ATPase